MRPTIHIILTIIAFFIIHIFKPLHYSVLVYAVILTFLIDLVEHGFVIIANNKDAKKIRKFLFKGRVKEAYTCYYNKRHGFEGASTFFHNFLFFLLITFLNVAYYKSYAIYLGITFHLGCDLVYDLITRRKLHESWFLNLRKLKK